MTDTHEDYSHIYVPTVSFFDKLFPRLLQAAELTSGCDPPMHFVLPGNLPNLNVWLLDESGGRLDGGVDIEWATYSRAKPGGDAWGLISFSASSIDQCPWFVTDGTWKIADWYIDVAVEWLYEDGKVISASGHLETWNYYPED
jgi:hypothetical protein